VLTLSRENGSEREIEIENMHVGWDKQFRLNEFGIWPSKLSLDSVSSREPPLRKR